MAGAAAQIDQTAFGQQDDALAIRENHMVDLRLDVFPSSHGGWAEEERALALDLQEAWRTRKLLFHDRAPRPYAKPAEKYYEDYWLHQQGARTLIVEVDEGMLATEGAEYEPMPGARR